MTGSAGEGSAEQEQAQTSRSSREGQAVAAAGKRHGSAAGDKRRVSDLRHALEAGRVVRPQVHGAA